MLKSKEQGVYMYIAQRILFFLHNVIFQLNVVSLKLSGIHVECLFNLC